jgi:hypothetical protein
MARGFLPTLPRAVVPEERYFVPWRVGPSRAEARIHEEMCDGTFRPPDAAERAVVDEVFAIYVPFWRVDLSRTDASVLLSSVQIGRIGVPVPHQQTNATSAVWMVSARSGLPYEMKHPSTLLPGDAKPLVLSLAALEHGDPPLTGGWELVDADVTAEQATSMAAAALAKHTQTAGGALFTESSHYIRAAHFVRYPIWFARYRYDGEASENEGLYYVGISALDGISVTAEHPSKLRAGAAKIKKFFRFE